MTLNLLDYINTVSILHIYNTTDKKRGKKRYILRNIRRKKCKVNTVGRPSKYNTVEEAKEAHRAKSLAHYHKARKQYKKDIDKSLSSISNKKLSFILANFISQHYKFNYFVTLTFNQIRFINKEKITTEYEYAYTIEQDYIQNQKALTLEYVQQCVTTYLTNLKHKNKQLIDYYFVTFEKNIHGDYHAHIALQITNTDKDYWTSYLTSRWYQGQVKTKKIRVDTPIKENTQNVIQYLCKDIEHKDLEIISWDTNIDKNSKRIFNTNDLDNLQDIEYWLSTDNAEQVLLLLPHLQKQTA